MTPPLPAVRETRDVVAGFEDGRDRQQQVDFGVQQFFEPPESGVAALIAAGNVEQVQQHTGVDDDDVRRRRHPVCRRSAFSQSCARRFRSSDPGCSFTKRSMIPCVIKWPTGPCATSSG